jgi:hypothetical protein
VRRRAVESADPPIPSHIAELASWWLSPTATKQIEEQLTDRMKREVARIDARLVANAGSPGATAHESPVGHACPHLKEWIHADRGADPRRRQAHFDIRAFRLTPDGAPRLFVRARWKLENAPVFLMTAWPRAETLPLEEM